MQEEEEEKKTKWGRNQGESRSLILKVKKMWTREVKKCEGSREWMEWWSAQNVRDEKSIQKLVCPLSLRDDMVTKKGRFDVGQKSECLSALVSAMNQI